MDQGNAARRAPWATIGQASRIGALLAVAAFCASADDGPAPLAVLRGVTVAVGDPHPVPGRALEGYIAVQGYPADIDNPSEREIWARLGLTTDSIPLLDSMDEEGNLYFGDGITVFRSALLTARAPGVTGPFGPRGDLYMDTRRFDDHVARLQAAPAAGGLGIRRERLTFGLGVVPGVLSCPDFLGRPCPPMDDYNVTLWPHDIEEWEALMRQVGAHLRRRGLPDPMIEFFPEPESYYLGRYRSVRAPEAMFDHAEFYVVTQMALQGTLPDVRLAAPGHAIFSHDLFGPAQDAVDAKDWLAHTQKVARVLFGQAKFQPSAVCWQGYMYGLEGCACRLSRDCYDEHASSITYDPTAVRLRVAVEYYRKLLLDLGLDPDVPQSISGWNYMFNNADYPEYPGYARDPVPAAEILRIEAASLSSQIVDWVTVYGDPNGDRHIDIRAHYYGWNDTDENGGQPVGTQSMIQAVHERVAVVPSAGEAAPANVVERVTYRPRETYRAFEALRGMVDGEIVKVAVVDASSRLRSLATRHEGGRVQVLLVDRYAEPLGELSVALDGLAPGAYAVTVRSIVLPYAAPGYELCAEWQEEPLDDIVVDGSGRAIIRLDRPDSLILIDVLPRP